MIASSGSAACSARPRAVGRGAFTRRIARTFPLDEIVAAHAEAERGHTQGKIVITIP